jgi:hypothetical protein
MHIGFLADCFSTIEAHDCRICEVIMPISFFNDIKQDSRVVPVTNFIWGADIKFCDTNEIYTVTIIKEIRLYNKFFIDDIFNNFESDKYHSLIDPKCYICKQLIKYFGTNIGITVKQLVDKIKEKD